MDITNSRAVATLCLNTTEGPITLVKLYAPTLSSTPNTKDELYENLTFIIRTSPSKEQLVLLGDFNTRVGADHDSWPSCLGRFGVGKMNENGQRLLEVYTYHQLCISNSFFQIRSQHKITWRHPCSKQWHQLDLILIRHACSHQACSAHPCLPQRSLGHRPLPGMLQDQVATKEVPPHSETGEPSHRHKQDVSARLHGAVCNSI